MPSARHFQFVGTDPAREAAGKAYYEYRAMLDACWRDSSNACDLLLDYEIDEAAWGRKKKPCHSTPATFSAIASDGTSNRLENAPPSHASR